MLSLRQIKSALDSIEKNQMPKIKGKYVLVTTLKQINALRKELGLKRLRWKDIPDVEKQTKI